MSDRLPIGARPHDRSRLAHGDVSERPKELASKASVVQATEGSNPSVTARKAERRTSLLVLPRPTKRSRNFEYREEG